MDAWLLDMDPELFFGDSDHLAVLLEGWKLLFRDVQDDMELDDTHEDAEMSMVMVDNALVFDNLEILGSVLALQEELAMGKTVVNGKDCYEMEKDNLFRSSIQRRI